MKSNDEGFWSISNWFTQQKRAVQMAFLIILNACVLAYLITAVMFFNAQGKFIICNNTDLWVKLWNVVTGAFITLFVSKCGAWGLYCQLLSAQTFNKSDSRVWLYAPKS
jgi:uncharacterized protein with PQ loop repeat